MDKLLQRIGCWDDLQDLFDFVVSRWAIARVELGDDPEKTFMQMQQFKNEFDELRERIIEKE